MRPHMRHHRGVLDPFCQFLFEILRVIADHHAVEFHQLVSHTWEFFFDALEADFDLASELIFSSPRVLLLENIVGMYESQPETVAFGEVMAQRHSEWSLRATLESIRTGRNKQHSAASQQQQIEQLLARIESRPRLRFKRQTVGRAHRHDGRHAGLAGNRLCAPRRTKEQRSWRCCVAVQPQWPRCWCRRR